MSIPTNDLFAILLGLCISGGWLIYKLAGFQWLPKIKDEKGIVVPSLLFLVSPFISVWTISLLANSNINEMIKLLLPVTTFILGQSFSKSEKQKEVNKKEIELATTLIYAIEQTVIQALSTIERKIMSTLRTCLRSFEIAYPV